MTHRIAVVSTVEGDARGSGYLHKIKSLFPESDLRSVSFVQAYTTDAQLSDAEIKKVAEQLASPAIEKYFTSNIPTPDTYAFAIEIGYLPGVTDNVGHTVQEMIEDLTGRYFAGGTHVYSSYFLFLGGQISHEEAGKMSQELFNPLIERATIFGTDEDIPLVVPHVKLAGEQNTLEVDLNVADAELMRISKEGIANSDASTGLRAGGSRRGSLALSLSAMKTIHDHFAELGRKPTDVELESLAQTWSEHCKHTIFNDPLDEVKEGIYRRYIKGATERIRKGRKGKNGSKGDFCVSVFKDNSGAIAFDDTYLITHKVETHNSPSGLDPFGGAVTAIVGVNRDCLGFGLGARPIANVYGFCVADPTDSQPLFRDSQRKQQLLSARRILEGIVRGINAGGNQSGIPTPLGFVAVDPSYRGKPLVFGGTVGLIPRKSPSGSRGRPRKLYEKCANPGDYIVMIGGRVGADGIHGATFSSESLSAGSPATAVQIGDPITQKKFSDALIREARDRGLYSSITDDGAGGLSGSVGEMARESGGALVDLEKVPLKYPGLAPWQIWISESQERMTLAVPKRRWTALKKIFDRHDVEATRIGEFTKSGRCVVRYKKKEVMNITLAFLHDGRPVEQQRSKQRTVNRKQNSELGTWNSDLGAALLKILARPSVGSTAFISQQYDHEVQGSSITKPLQGKGRVNADAAVLQPLPHSQKGVVLAHGCAPWYSQIDTYTMAAASIDTAVRNAICAGASRDYLAILDNFCWSSSDTPERLHELKEAARACYDVAVAYGTPFISGKDSMFNDFKGFDSEGNRVHIAALPTLLISAIGVMLDIGKALTIDFKHAGDLVYVVGETNDELGASEYCTMLGEMAGAVPRVDVKKNARAYDAVGKAIERGLLASAIGVGRGGLGVALAKSAIAGQLGMRLNLIDLPGTAKTTDNILFSESQGRMLVSIRRDARKEFERIFKSVALTNIGEVVQAQSLAVEFPETRISLELPTITQAYRSFFREW
ncbi:MAG TPA: AIR synthase-related protein [Candidatus Paceibacterota bacterium]